MLCLSSRITRLPNVRLTKCPKYTTLLHSQNYKAFSTSGFRLVKSDSEKPKVKWFQQLFPGSQWRPADPNNPALDEEEYEERKRLKEETEQYDAEIRELEGGGGKTLVEPLLADLSLEDQKKVREAIRQDEIETARKDNERAALKKRLEQLAPKKKDLEITLKLPPDQNRYLEALNANIQRAAIDFEDRDLRKNLWLAYLRCKAFLPPFLHLIPETSWSILWNSQQTLSTDDPQWASRLIALAEDMLAVDKKMGFYQRVLYIEALRSENRIEKAISQWKEIEDDVGDDKQASEEYRWLGVRLFTSHKDLMKAEQLALDHVGDQKRENRRLLIPILAAWAQRGDDDGVRHAWALYLRYKILMSSEVTMDDYDSITMIFLGVGRTDLALAVFKDMMLTGQETEQNSVELYKKSLELIGKTQSSAVTAADLNKISLTGLTVLPRKFQNKYFYGSWLKKLIGMGETDAAAAVVELMHERGVKSDSKHLNGIIGAWLRTSTAKAQKAAEELAWAMIHERLDFVHNRQRDKLISTNKVPIPRHLVRTVAPANIETFSLLLQHYGRRAQTENVQLVCDNLERAAIRPNTYFINHLLYIDLRRHKHQAAYTRYLEMFRGIKPDLKTFACLWDCEKAHLDNLEVHSRDKFPGPREIMREMMNWIGTIRPQERELVQQQFNRELYDQVIRCVGRSSDQEGLIVALYALEETFGLYPNEETARLVNLHVSRMGLGEEESRKSGGRKRRKNPQRRGNERRIAQVFAIITQQRNEVLANRGFGNMEQVDEHIREEEGLFILAEFLRTVLRKTTIDESLVETNIEKAAWEMGASGIRMGDPLEDGYGQNNRLE